MAITGGLFSAQIEEINSILLKCGFVKNFLKKNKATDYTRNIYRTNDIKELYKKIVDQRDYTFQLKDDSLIQFSFDEVDGELILGYCFIPFPLEVQTYEDFLLGYDIDPEDDQGTLRDYYEQSIVEAPARNGLIVIRYDYSTKEYSETIHSVSHIHFGFGDIRITSQKIIDPKTFLFFILKQVYYDDWKEFINKRHFRDEFMKCKLGCDDISTKLFSASDQKELYLC